MEYIVIGSIALAVFIFFIIIIKVEVFRNKANALFLEAEKYVTQDKLEYVCSNLYGCLPNVLKMLMDERFLKEVIQTIYDHTRKIAKDILDDR